MEGLIAGWIYGGINAVLLSMLFGAGIGLTISVIAWRIRRRARSFLLPFLFGIALEAFGGGLIVLLVRINGPMPDGVGVGMIYSATIGIPFMILFKRLIRRETIAAYRGLLAGVIVGPIIFGILIGSIAAQGFGGNAAILLFVLGRIGGVLMGGIFGALLGPLLGGLINALVNVTRNSIAPTYVGLVAAIALGLTGFHAGEALAGDFGGFMGVALGVLYGALLGGRLGRFMTPHLLGFFNREDERDPLHSHVLDLSDARDLADAEPAHLVLCQLLLSAIRSPFQQLRLEQSETACIASVMTGSSLLPYSCPLPLYPALLQLFKEPAYLEENEKTRLTSCQERLLRLHLKRHSLDMRLAFQSGLNGERADLCWSYDPEAAQRAEQVLNALHFILKARASFHAPVRLGRGGT